MVQNFSSRLLNICIVAVAVLGSVNSAHAEKELSCKATIESVLEKYEIEESNIRKMYVINQYTGGGAGGGGWLEYRNGWVDLKSCKGSLVVKMDPDCDIEEVFTRYGCKIPGLKKY